MLIKCSIRVVLKEELSKNKVFILFINTNCPACKNIIKEIAESQDSYQGTFLVINNDTTVNDYEYIKSISDEIHYIKSPNIFTSYHINSTPYFILVDLDGNIEFVGEVSSFKQIQIMLLNEQVLVS